MINIPLKEYQFTGIITILGLIILSFSGIPVPYTPVNIINVIGFVIGAGLFLIGGLVTVVCFFMGDNVRFKQ